MDKTLEVFIEIKKPIHFLKIFVGYLVIGLAAVSPLIVAYVGSSIESKIVGHPVNEGNSAIFSVFWFAILTIPGGIVFSVIFTFYYLKNVFLYFKDKKKQKF